MITGLSVNYVKNWTTVEAIRELLQNYIDAGQGVLNYENGFLTISDHGNGIKKDCWAIGESHKGNNNSIGQFGEGLKLAMLVLARENRKTELRSLNYSVYPRITRVQDYGEANVLELVFSHCEPIIGTTIVVECSNEEYYKARKLFFALENTDFVSPNVSLGDSIYVNGVSICSYDDLSFSYHLNGDRIRSAINRDRSSVDFNIISNEIAELSKTFNTSVWLSLLQKKDTCKESTIFMYESPGLLEAVKILYGDKIAIQSESQYDKYAEHLGYNVIDFPVRWCWALNAIGIIDGYKLSKNYHQPKEIKPTSEEKITLEKCVRKAKTLWNKTEYNMDFPTIKVAETINIDLDYFAKGLYERESNTIFINHVVLNSMSDTLSTIVHELGHALGGDDITQQFEDSLVKLLTASLS